MSAPGRPPIRWRKVSRGRHGRRKGIIFTKLTIRSGIVAIKGAGSIASKATIQTGTFSNYKFILTINRHGTRTKPGRTHDASTILGLAILVRDAHTTGTILGQAKVGLRLRIQTTFDANGHVRGRIVGRCDLRRDIAHESFSRHLTRIGRLIDIGKTTRFQLHETMAQFILKVRDVTVVEEVVEIKKSFPRDLGHCRFGSSRHHHGDCYRPVHWLLRRMEHPRKVSHTLRW